MKHKYQLTVRSPAGPTYAFPLWLDPAHVPIYLAHGLEVDRIYNTVPVWAVRIGLLRTWIAVQDVFAFRWRRL